MARLAIEVGGARGLVLLLLEADLRNLVEHGLDPPCFELPIELRLLRWKPRDEEDPHHGHQGHEKWQGFECWRPEAADT